MKFMIIKDYLLNSGGGKKLNFLYFLLTVLIKMVRIVIKENNTLVIFDGKTEVEGLEFIFRPRYMSPEQIRKGGAFNKSDLDKLMLYFNEDEFDESVFFDMLFIPCYDYVTFPISYYGVPPENRRAALIDQRQNILDSISFSQRQGMYLKEAIESLKQLEYQSEDQKNTPKLKHIWSNRGTLLKKYNQKMIETMIDHMVATLR